MNSPPVARHRKIGWPESFSATLIPDEQAPVSSITLSARTCSTLFGERNKDAISVLTAAASAEKSGGREGRDARSPVMSTSSMLRRAASVLVITVLPPQTNL